MLTTLVAALLIAATALPVVGITGIAVRDAANTFDTLQVGKLGAAPARSVLYDTEGKPIAYFYPYDVYRVPVTFNQIAPVMRNAIVAIEDAPFYNQGALDPRGTLRALVSTGSGTQLQGASTLAQQYVKNVKVLQAGNNQAAALQAYAPNLQRKIQQLRLAAAVEHELTPQQLLTSYLNVAYFDNHAYGIQVAAQTYFSKSASRLTLPEAALLAGIVQSPTAYDPFAHPAAALQRRSEVLTRMWQLHYVSKPVALAAEKTPLDLKPSSAPVSVGCASPSVTKSAFFCDYVEHVLKLQYPSVWSDIQNSGGLAISTTLNMKDQLAADRAVNYVEPPHDPAVNPNRNADTEVLIQPGTGNVRAIAVNRTYGSQDDIDYAVNEQYGGDQNGVQTGSSSKIFTLITALKQGYPFGHTIKIQNPETIGPFATCHGLVEPAKPYNNAEAAFKGSQVWQLNEATVQSVNTYFVNLENEVGLCNVVKTAVDMGMTRADGTSLMKYDRPLGVNGFPAYDYSSFTLGSVGVSPMSMAAAYASVAARGWYCSPQAITKIEVMATHKQLPVRKASCHRDMSRGVADAANYILQGVLDQSGGTAANRALPGRHVAGKTGTADNGYFAAFAGYTPKLASYTSVFNPLNPIKYNMVGSGSCYRDLSGPTCPGQMFGDNAPAATWEYTFLRVRLGPDVPFVYPPSSYFSLGSGLGAPKTIGGKKKPGKGGPGQGGPGHGGPTPTPTPTH
ncbi:MAG TPA: transglycosylase domain-containing protein [Streptosporangiaceae bacterium]